MAKIVTSCFSDCNVTIGYSENDLERLDNLETFLAHLAGELSSEHGQAGCMGALEAVEEKLKRIDASMTPKLSLAPPSTTQTGSRKGNCCDRGGATRGTEEAVMGSTERSNT